MSAPIGLALCSACGGAFSSNFEQRMGPSDAGHPDVASLHSQDDAMVGARSGASDDAASHADAVAIGSRPEVAVVDAATTQSDADQASDANEMSDADDASGGGGSNEASVGAGGGCPNGCGPQEVCAYPIKDACMASGMCVAIPPPAMCQAIMLETACGCDGQAVQWAGGCQPLLPDGYAPSPVRHKGAC